MKDTSAKSNYKEASQLLIKNASFVLTHLSADQLIHVIDASKKLIKKKIDKDVEAKKKAYEKAKENLTKYAQ